MTKLTPQQQRLVTDALEEFSVMARSMAKRLKRVTVDDLIGAIHLELMRAAADFVPTRGTSFRAYASRGVVGAMLDCATKEQKAFAWKVAGSFLRTAESQEAPEEQESIEMSFEPAPSPHDVLAQSIQARAAAIATRLVLAPMTEGSEDETIEHLDRKRALSVVLGLLASFSEEERELIRLLYEQGRTLSQVGEQLGIHQRSVQRVHNRVREKLGQGLHAAGMKAAQHEHA